MFIKHTSGSGELSTSHTVARVFPSYDMKAHSTVSFDSWRNPSEYAHE